MNGSRRKITELKVTKEASAEEEGKPQVMETSEVPTREVGSKSLQRKAAAGIDMLNPIFAHH